MPLLFWYYTGPEIPSASYRHSQLLLCVAHDEPVPQRLRGLVSERVTYRLDAEGASAASFFICSFTAGSGCISAISLYNSCIRLRDDSAMARPLLPRAFASLYVSSSVRSSRSFNRQYSGGPWVSDVSSTAWTFSWVLSTDSKE